jgi:hypothetical protein
MKRLNKKLLLFFVSAIFLTAGFLLFSNISSAAAQGLDLGLKPVAAAGLPSGDIRTIIANIIRVALGLLGIVALALVLYAGYEWMTAGGNEDQIASSKKILFNAVIGLAIILSAYAIVSFVMNKLIEATTGVVTTSEALCKKQIQETGKSCDGACPPCDTCVGSICYLGKDFHIVKTPASGNVCIRNFAPVIVFSLDVDKDTLAGRLVVIKDAVKDSEKKEIEGTWSWQPNHNHIAIFKAKGDCPDGSTGCFEPNTKYILRIKNNGAGIKSTDNKDLICSVKYKCDDVPFVTGDAVDKNGPTIKIVAPVDGTALMQGSNQNVEISFNDDAGLQNIILNANDALVNSVNFQNCQKSGKATIVWPTNNIKVGDYTLDAIGWDWAATYNQNSIKVQLKPAYCFDKQKNFDEQFIDCGGVCGVCQGGKCALNSDCTSNYCEKAPGAAEGICIDRMQITAFSPDNGAKGDFVSIGGKYFGSKKGHVYFAKVKNPTVGKAGDWTEAQIADCGAGVNNWTDNQIIVSVPNDALSGPIQVQTGDIVGVDGKTRQFNDTTADNWGPKFTDWQLTNQVHPGVCAINPATGAVGDLFTVLGKNFGQYDGAKDSLKFQDTKTKISSWDDTQIKSSVPISLGNGDFSVKVDKNGIISNGIKFSVSGSALNGPIITSLSTSSVVVGDYLTIYGNNFGEDTGKVWFKLNGQGDALNGSFDFPNICKTSVWNNNQVVVKIPKELDNSGKNYTVQIVRSALDGLSSPLDNSKIVTVKVGNPNPGICKISPVSGPVPFTGNKVVTLSGEYLSKVNKVLFYSNQLGLNLKIVDDKEITIQPDKNTITGPVLAVSGLDGKLSNSVLFSASDCVKNGCSAGNKCCLAGNEAGNCKPQNELCSGEFKTSGYVWLFSTKKISAVPQVVERCGADTEAGSNLPSPSPSTQWNVSGHTDASQVCQTALATVEFSTNLDKNSIANNVEVYSCTNIDATGKCVDPKKIILTADSFVLKTAVGDPQGQHPFLSISPENNNVNRWTENQWYQVVLKTGIKSPPDAKGNSLALAVTKPCGLGTAYCYAFKTGQGDCKLKQVIITPKQFWTQILESPIKYRTAGGDLYDLFFQGNGLSSQYCTMMSVNGFNWQWSTGDIKYSKIIGDNKKIKIQASAEANTVGIGLANNSVDIKAAASAGNLNYSASSPLTIDLSNPEVVDYWPNCLEACTNASIGAKFNISMSMHNVALGTKAVKFMKCTDENCLSTVNIDLPDLTFDQTSNNTILKIANDKNNLNLEKDTLYQVVLSVTSTAGKDNGDQLWSLSKLSNLADPNNFAKPYNKVFTWRFRTKKEACQIDRVEVSPKVFTAKKIFERTVFEAQPYSSPDACSAVGQKLNAWNQNWNWSSSNLEVAAVNTFSTKGSGAFCTANCLLKGSTVPSGQVGTYPVCGNAKVEAGEDCDSPDKTKGCGLDCRFIGNLDKTSCGNGKVEMDLGEACDPKDPKTQVGCSDICRHIGSSLKTQAQDVKASICGNGALGSGEDCDLGIASDINSTKSALLCSQNCLHLGTRLSTKWCFDHGANANPAFGGFEQKDYKFYCNQAYSQCGDGISSPDEDENCDLGGGKHAVWCDDSCLNIKLNPNQNPANQECVPNSEGCNENGQHVGSSLLYTTASVCGDTQVGMGEDAKCESANYLTNIWHKDTDPWVLTIGQGKGKPVGTPPVQTSDIKAATNGGKNSGIGKYQVQCGYASDAECEAAYGSANFGVGSDSCCYAHPKLTSVYPGTIAPPAASNICINTSIEANFDSVIDPSTLPGNFIVARSAAAACGAGLEDVGNLIKFSYDSSSPWYKKIWVRLVFAFKNIFGSEVTASTWCAGADIGDVNVVKDGSGGSKILFSLKNPLASSTEYAVILKSGIKNDQGVSIQKGADGKALGWRFVTGKEICQVSSVRIEPEQFYFSAPNASSSFVAKAITANNQIISSIPGFYSWNYQWGPSNNPYVTIANTTNNINVITAQNHNGEVDVHAAANIVENKYTAQTGLVGTGKTHIIVFLCENPWPPKQLSVPGKTTPAVIFPYEDKEGNNDGFDLTKNVFNNNAIAPSLVAGNGYFNFSTYYCADNGEYGTNDDLPYLRPAVQVIGKTCEQNPLVPCASDDDCSFGQVTVFGSTFEKVKKGFCTITYDQGTSYSPYMISAGAQNSILQCNFDSDCQSDPGFADWYNNFSKFYADAKAVCKPLNWFNLPKSKCSDSSGGIAGFKRFILTNDRNKDAIGVQVLPNPKHLSARDWFTIEKMKGGQGFVGNLQDTILKGDSTVGNDAVTDGNNIYVNALNFVPATAANHGNLYSNIYLFSLNEGALPESRKVFEELIKNLKFNINLTNYGYCGKDINNPGDTKTCISDFDCPTGEVCSNQKDKLKRNFNRLLDLSNIEKSLADYNLSHNNTYPDLQSGTYLSGQTISTWPSWTILGNATGGSLPSDPVNKLGLAGTCSITTGKFCTDNSMCPNSENCVIHDASTGWSTADKRFSFACAPNSLAYRYIASSSDYIVKFRFEDTGLIVDNFGNLVKDLIKDNSHFNILSTNSICNQDQEISTLNQGKCGDGQLNLNKGEQCDPVGSIVWDQSKCTVAGATSNTLMPGQICASNCQWSLTPTSTKCGILAKCGNGKLEVGEFCDEGGLNGKYNHCNANCSGLAASCGDGIVTSTYEYCDIKTDYYPDLFYQGYNQHLGWCVSGLLGSNPCSTDDDCKIQPEQWDNFKSAAEVGTVGSCVSVSSNNIRYGLDKTKSCNFDCQKVGPYCGDNIVQSEFGEECEGNQNCAINGEPGNRVCGFNCRWEYKTATTSPILYYNFDDVVTRRSGWKPLSTQVIGDLSFILNKGSAKSGNSTLNAAHCVGTANTGCPAPSASFSASKYQAMQFNGTSNYFAVDSSGSFNINELTIATWLKVDPNTTNGWHAILSKQGPGGTESERDFNFYVVTNGSPAAVTNLHFYSKNNKGIIFGVNNATDGTKPIFSSNEWHFVAITVNANRVVKYYLDGNLLSAPVTNGNPTLKADSNYPIWIGRADNWFKGSLDETQLFGRALSSGEISDLYKNSNNFCELKSISAGSASSPVALAGCGDKKVDANEACDNGSNNGVACLSDYNKQCTYCSADCKNVIAVSPNGYCGDGIVNGPEVCDLDSSSDLIFSSVTNTGSVASGLLPLFTTKDENHNGYLIPACENEYNLKLNSSSTEFYKTNQFDKLIGKVGTKSCVNTCSTLQTKCVECGQKDGGAVLSGALINVLDPKSDNPLIAESAAIIPPEGHQGTIDLLYSPKDKPADHNNGRVAYQYYDFGDSLTKFLLHPAAATDANAELVATVNSSPICSDASQARSYKIALNADWSKAHLIDFPVFGTTTADKYNLLLSPVIQKSVRSQDVRIVVSWVGNSGDFEFNGGFLIPSNQAPLFEDNNGSMVKSTGIKYYNSPASPLNAVWYHDYVLNNFTNTESFTVNSGALVTSSYAFYLRSVGGPINKFKTSAQLKVELYFPEDQQTDENADTYRHFARPTKVYYLSQAMASDSSDAVYWHVFNINKTAAGTVVSLNDIKDISRMRSFIKMNYSY